MTAQPGSQQVTEFLENLDHPLKKEVEELRRIIVGSGTHLTEHIKWKAPSFCLNGNDIITFKLYPAKHVQVIFHRGAKVKEQPERRLIDDQTGLLSWVANDRAVATFTGMENIQAQRDTLVRTVQAWTEAAGK